MTYDIFRNLKIPGTLTASGILVQLCANQYNLIYLKQNYITN